MDPAEVVITVVGSILAYATVGLRTWAVYRRRHVQTCSECRKKIEQNVQSDDRWDSLLCDKYDMGSFVLAVFWPVVPVAWCLWRFTRLSDPRPTWLSTRDLQMRISELERELAANR